MDKEEAKAVLAAALAPYKGQTYTQLRQQVDKQYNYEVIADSGKTYQVEIQIFWDHPGQKQDIRVLGTVDDGHLLFLTTYMPFTDDFIITPQGTHL